MPRILLLVILSALLVGNSLPLYAEEAPMELTADSFRYTPDNKLTATGAVKVVYKDFTIEAEEMEADLDKEIAYFPGPVTLTGKDQKTQGKELYLNMKTRQWSFDDASAVLTEKLLRGAKAPLMVAGKQLRGSPKLITLEGCDLTSCPLTTPHYTLKARSISIYPERKLVARKVSFMVGQYRLFGLPSIVVPLEPGAERQFPMPQVGQSTQEGAYIKTSYNYLTGTNSHGALKLDMTQKLGIGTGIEHAYKLFGGAGTLYLYQFLTSGQRTGRLEHTQKLGDMRLQLTADIRDNSYQYASNFRTSNLLLYITRNVGPADSTFSINTNAVSGYGSYRTLTSNFQHNQSFGKRTRASLAMDYSQFLTPQATTADTELQSKLELRNQFPNFDFVVSASKRYDLDGSRYTGDQYYSGVQKLPEMMLSTDSYHFKKGPLSLLPMRLQMGYGEFLEQPSNIQTSRALAQFDLLGKELTWGKTGLNLGGGFRQAVYGDGTAQYLVTENFSLTRKIGNGSEASINYFYQRPHGYTPFRFDYVVPYKVATARLKIEESPRFSLLVAMGHDFLAPAAFKWQDLLLRTTYQPWTGVSLINSAGYDMNRRQMRSFTSRVKLELKNGLQMDTGARWDLASGLLGGGTQTKLSAFKTHFTTPNLWGKWKIEAYIGHDGYMRYSDIMLTRDLHCWEASVIYVNETGTFQSQRGLRFAISLKAFPFQQRFGIGQFGQSLDSAIGEVY